MKPGTVDRRMFRLPPERSVRRSWERSPMREGRGWRRCAGLRPWNLFCALIVLLCALPLLSCASKPGADTLVMIIESSPTNLDPRVGIDGFSERIDNLIFDDLLERDENLNVRPALAERWEIPDPLTYIFHLRSGVRFHNGQPLTSRDVKWTLDSLLT